MHVRTTMFLTAFALMALHWFAWSELPFEVAIAGGVLWSARRREELVRTLETERAQHLAMARQLAAAEERYRSLVETLPLATYIDRPDTVTGAAWVSPQIGRITSYGPQEWVADPGLLAKVRHPDDRERVLDEMRRAKDARTGVDHEYRIVRSDGSTVWIHDSSVAVEEDGRLFARGFVVDVTARREAELELERQNERLRELDKLKDEFIALVSHELRTPLTSIRGYLELMAEDTNFTDDQLRFLQTIDRNAVRLQRVVGDLLFCAQVDAGKLSLERAEFDLNGIVRDAVEAGRPAAAHKQIRLEAELGDLPPLNGDRARLAQVLDNFVSNAIKFTPSGGRVALTTRIDEAGFEIAVADTGVGISKADLPRLFQRFFRTDRAAADAIPGTGLGLTIAKAIVEGHGGRVEVESVEGEGTTFRVLLPA
jgi:PAS domain S-box-containing protein